MILSSPNLQQGQVYHVYTGGMLDGYTGRGYLTDVTTVTGYTDGTQMAYSGSDVGMGFGRPGMGDMQGFRGDGPDRSGDQAPEDFDPSAFTRPDGDPFSPGEMPRDGFGDPGMNNPPPDEPRRNGTPPAMPDGERPQGAFENQDTQSQKASTEFYMTDPVNAFSGLTPA